MKVAGGFNFDSENYYENSFKAKLLKFNLNEVIHDIFWYFGNLVSL